MASMTDMLNMLSDREQAKFVAGQELSQAMREADKRVTGVTESLMEKKRAQDQELKLVKAQCEKRFRDISLLCRQQVHKAQKEQAEAEGRADIAEKEMTTAEAHAYTLEQKLIALKQQLEQRKIDADMNVAETERIMSTRVTRVRTQAEKRVSDMAAHTRDVMAHARTTHDETLDEMRDQLARAHVRAEGRTRFKELRDLAKSIDSYEMGRPEYRAMKDELVNLWHFQSLGPASPMHSLGPDGKPCPPAKTFHPGRDLAIEAPPSSSPAGGTASAPQQTPRRAGGSLVAAGGAALSSR